LLRNLLESEDSELTPEVQAIVDAFVAGANRSFGEPRIAAGQVIAFSRRAYASIHGSNDLFLPPSRTASKSVIAILDPIADWNAPDRPYEMSLYASVGDLSLAGVAPVGMPFPIVGHSQFVALGWSGDSAPAGPRALEEAWLLITAKSIGDVRRALAMNQIAGNVSCGTVQGELCQEAIPANPALREKLRVQQTWPFASVEALAMNNEVVNAETWQRLLARVVPEDRFARILTGWNRRADADSRPALAFYLFKMELARDASFDEPPDSISVARIRAALKRAQDRLETERDFHANWGTEFRISREGSRTSFPASGGNVPEAGMATPRTLYFTDRRAHAGQAALRVVELSRTPGATSLLLPGVSDDPSSSHFVDQAGLAKPKPTFFRNRRELERSASSRKQVTF
jgi:acyl-homoserine lactone acylase PvdQ